MAKAVIMPKAGITVEECVITRWEKHVGDMINAGDVLFSYETDKAAFECESTESGELLEIFYGDGSEVPVLVNVCAIGEKGDNIDDLRPDTVKQETKSEAVVSAENIPEDIVPAKKEGTDLSFASPRAKALASENGIDTGFIAGTGPYGRVLERDVRFIIDNAGSGLGGRLLMGEQPASDSVDASDNCIYPHEDIAFTKIRSSIAAAMIASLNNIPQLTHHHTFDATSILEYRAKLKIKSQTENIQNITLNDILLYAVSRVLINHKNLNAHVINGNTIRQFGNVNLGIATDTQRGLMVPTIFNADEKSIEEISKEAKELVEAAKAGNINPDLLQGGTFTVSNLGALGVNQFTPIINPPQTGILGVCNIETKLKMRDGVPVPYQAMGLSLTYDHRAVDGAPAAKFIMELSAFLESFKGE